MGITIPHSCLKWAVNHKDAEKYYAKVIGHTTDLILEIYTGLQYPQQIKTGEKSQVKNVGRTGAHGQKISTKIPGYYHYMAAQMLLDGGRTDDAMGLLEEEHQYRGNDPSQRNRASELAELSFCQKQYRDVYNWYDM